MNLAEPKNKNNTQHYSGAYGGATERYRLQNVSSTVNKKKLRCGAGWDDIAVFRRTRMFAATPNDISHE